MKSINRLLNQELYNREKKNNGQRAYDPDPLNMANKSLSGAVITITPSNIVGIFNNVMKKLKESRKYAYGYPTWRGKMLHMLNEEEQKEFLAYYNNHIVVVPESYLANSK